MTKVNDDFGYSTGSGAPLTRIFKFPIIKNRNPTTSDINFRLGQQWINPTTSTAFILGSVSGGTAIWIAQGSGAIGGVITLTGDSGGPLSPAGGNIDIFGTADQIDVSGAGSSLTLSLIGPYTPSTFTDHGILVGSGSTSITAVAVMTDGQVLLGATGADPAPATISSPDSSIDISSSAGSLRIQRKSITQTLSAADVRSLRATPFEIIPAPNAGETILISHAQLKLVYGGTNVFTNPQNLQLKYTDGVGVAVCAAITAAGFVDQADSMYTSTTLSDNNIVTALASEVQPIVLHNVGGSEITGNAADDNTLVVTVYYSILTQ